MENESMQEEIQVVKKATRGGARPGAGRKKKYEDSYDFKRLKCKAHLVDYVRTAITVLDSMSEKELEDVFCHKLNGENPEKKGAQFKTWYDSECFSTPWSIRINDEFDERIFVLAFILVNPDFVRIHWMTHDGTVQLRWQRVDEIGKLMMTYGNLMARRNRLKASEQEILNEIPDWSSDMIAHIKEKLNHF